MNFYLKNRKVGEESLKTYQEKINNGFFDKYMSGKGLDIGYAGYISDVLPILDSAIGIDKNYPNYDGVTLPFADNSQDYIYSSHMLEHVDDRTSIIKDWMRVLKPKGYIICIVPNYMLYEKKETLPSIWNNDHKVFFSPGSLLLEFEAALPYNSFRVRYMKDEDDGHDYNQPVNEHSKGCYETTLVIQKL